MRDLHVLHVHVHKCIHLHVHIVQVHLLIHLYMCMCKVAIGRYAVRAGVSVLVELSMFVSEEAEESPSPTSRRAIVLRLIKLCQLSGKLRDESQSPLKMVVN